MVFTWHNLVGRNLAGLAGGLLILGLVGCASTPTVEEEEESFTPRDDTLVSTLEQEQIEALCDHSNAKVYAQFEDDVLKNSICLTVGAAETLDFSATDEERLQACQATAGECNDDFLAFLLDVETDDDDEAFCPTVEEVADCHVTIAEVDACLDAVMDWLFEPARELGVATCEDVLTQDGLMSVLEAMENFEHLADEDATPPAIEGCYALHGACPEFW